ncbi:MAG: MFS transporter [Solirubrobacterales bacterium]|nr:MFS transporter [Solirubrobacterales bacterium]
MTAAPPAQRLGPWTLWFGGLAFFTCYLGQTALGVIQPTIESDLGLSSSEAQWVVNSFFLTLALFAAPGGRLGDYYGHRRVLLAALSVFALGSLSAAVSQGFVWLIASIGVAGMGAATLYPSSAAMIANRVPLESRGHAIGNYSAIGATVFVIGPLMAGLLTEAIDWRALFALQFVVGAVVASMGWRKVDDQPVGEPEPFDATGLVVLMAGLTAVLVAMMQALAWGWDSPATLVLFAAGVAVLGGFAALELRTAHPLLDLGLLRRRVIVGIVLSMFAAQFILNGFIIYIATYFQHVLGYGALLASLAMLPALLGLPYFCIVAGRLTDRFGARRPALAGFVASAAAFAWIAATVDAGSYWLLLPGLAVLSVALSPMFTSLLTALSNAVGAEERGDANALVLTVRWVGAAAGTMVLGVVIRTAGDGAAVPGASAYSAAFVVEAAVVLLGGLACALLLRDPPAEQRPKHHHFRPHL